MLTSEALQKEFNRLSNPILQTKCRGVVAGQRKKEESILREKAAMPLSNVAKALPSADLEVLDDKVKESFDNPNVMRLTSELMKGVYYHADHSNGTLARADEVMRWFNEGEIIGKPSANGLVTIVSLRDATDIAVIKAPLKKEKELDMVHEVFVASKGTNALRSRIPNFAYVYGGFRCAPSVFDNDGKLVSVCGLSKTKTQYAVYEAITPGKDLASSIPKLTNPEFYNNYLQIALATLLAWEELDWTHYDLHNENVILREVPHLKKFCIRYRFRGKALFVTATKVATIIDFGYSHIKVDGQHYGYCIASGGIEPSESNPINDLYKLLLFTAEGARKGNSKLMTLLRKIFSFFSKEKLEDAVLLQRDFYYSIPKALAKQFSLNDFIEFLIDEFPEYNSVVAGEQPKGIPVLGCSNGCESVSDVARDLELSVTDVKEVIDFYDLYETTRNRKALVKNFAKHYDISMSDHLKYLDGIVKELNGLLDDIEDAKIDTQTISGYSDAVLFSGKTLLRLQEYEDATKKAIFLAETISNYINIGKDVANVYNDKQTVADLDVSYVSLKKTSKYLEKINVTYQNVRAVLYRRATSVSGNRYIRENPAFKWYL